MNDQRFFDLAMKAISRRGTEAERAELEALVASRPELKAEWEKLQADARLAREVVPLAATTQSSAGQFPAYARERLQTRVRETLGQAKTPAQRRGRNWRWILGWGGAAALVIMFVVLQSARTVAPVLQIAMLDTAGAVRGSETNELGILQEQWKGSTVQSFDKAAELEAWRTHWPEGTRHVVKVIYDRTAGEVRVLWRGSGQPIERVFVVQPDLATALRQADAFIREQTSQ